MTEFIHQIGIDWKLLLGQAVNFLLLLIILRVTLYKPILKVLKERRARIEEGITKAEVADKRLEEVNLLAKGRMHEAEEQALDILRDAEKKAKQSETNLLKEAEKKEAAILKKAEQAALRKQEELERQMAESARKFVKDAIVATCELDPSSIDEALVKKAVAHAGKRS